MEVLGTPGLDQLSAARCQCRGGVCPLGLPWLLPVTVHPGKDAQIPTVGMLDMVSWNPCCPGTPAVEKHLKGGLWPISIAARVGIVSVSSCCCDRLPDYQISSFTAGQESKISFPGLKSRCSRAGSSWRLWRRLRFWPSPASRSCLYSLACGPFFHLQSTSLQPLLPWPHHLLFCSPTSLCLPLYKDTCHYIQGPLKGPRVMSPARCKFNHICKSLFHIK